MQILETRLRSHVLPAVLLLAIAGVSCTGKRSGVTVENEEQAAPRVASVIRMNDPSSSAQLLSGFYPIENNSWRWTAGKFSALLRTPPGAAQSGATLTMAFVVPEIVIRKVGNVTLRASIGGTALKPETWTAAGTYEYSADVPPSMLAPESVKVDFALDKSLPPDVDRRELGIIVTSVGLASK
jgi:hypothetical protein